MIKGLCSWCIQPVFASLYNGLVVLVSRETAMHPSIPSRAVAGNSFNAPVRGGVIIGDPFIRSAPPATLQRYSAGRSDSPVHFKHSQSGFL